MGSSFLCLSRVFFGLFQPYAAAGTWLTERAKEGTGRKGAACVRTVTSFQFCHTGRVPCAASPLFDYGRILIFISSLFIIPFKYSDFIILFVYI